MSRSTVQGLQSALRLYESDKVRDRAEGHNRIRDIFSNRENLLAFQETASRDGGAGWVAFFQCLFQVVVLEKKGWLKKASGGPQAEKRLADAISLVRWMAEKCVYSIGRKPLQALATHMTTLLVYSSTIFPPAALDYAKALRSLLSYPPHLENLDQNSWKILTGVCWSAILGDAVSVDDGWDEGIEEEEHSPPTAMPTQVATSLAKGRSTVTQATNEFALLIPILLSSSAAPLIPPLPVTGGVYIHEPSLGLNILFKAQRFFAQYSGETSSHLPILRSMNIVLAALELNARHDFIAGSLKLLPHLVGLWTMRNKQVREQVLIGLRMMLPFVTRKVALEKDKTGVIRTSLERLYEVLPKEAVSRWGLEPLEIGVIRLRSQKRGNEDKRGLCPFETGSFTAGQDFSHESALKWAALELYSEICFHLYHTIDPPHNATPTRSDGTQAKRRKMSDSLSTLVRATGHGAHLTRVQALQVLIMLVDRHWDDVHLEAQLDIRQTVLSFLDEDEPNIQSWAFIGISALVAKTSTDTAVAQDLALPTSSAQVHRHQSEATEYARAWSHAIRKSSLATVSRSACHAANAILLSNKIDPSIVLKDIGSLLRNIDIQGPPYPHDSVCALISEAVCVARKDIRLYSMNLEEKIISWAAKWNAVEGTRGKGRVDQHAPADILPLLCNVTHLANTVIAHPTTLDLLPDCAIVDRILEEQRTHPIRQFTLFGMIADMRPAPQSIPTPATSEVAQIIEQAAFLEGGARRVSDILGLMLDDFCRQWPSNKTELEARPAIQPDRCRRTVDAVVLALAYQATLQLNGIRTDSNVLQSSTRLLELIVPLLKSTTYDIPAHHLMWKGLEPLVQMTVSSQVVWPVLLRPNAHSGIRRDMLKREMDQDTLTEGGYQQQDALLTALWNLPGLSVSLKTLFEPALALFKGSEAIQMPNDSPHVAMPVQEDDDFGEIRTAETDAMPVSKEAMECQRTTISLFTLLSRIRLRGHILLSTTRNPSKDIELMNAFFSAEGPRLVQLGTVLCQALQDGILRVSLATATEILGAMEEMLKSYAYSRDEALLKMILTFMTGSAPVWLATEAVREDLGARVIHLARFFHAKAIRNQLPSWKVRLALVVFIDEYLDYDPEQVTWSNAIDNEMETGEADVLATDIVAEALVDPDIRLRFRAATSTAGILYLTSIPVHQHVPFYHDTVVLLPREIKHWDSFVTDILWKLNCCVTSPQLRAATIYHLYEVPPATAEYNNHLQNGLETVSTRLGLTGIAPLCLAHAPLIISSQICGSQSPMRVPHRLYGFGTRKAFAIAALDVAASSILLALLAERARTDEGAREYIGAGETFAALCDAAGLAQADVTKRHLPATAARAISDPASPLFPNFEAFSREQAVKLLISLPGVSTEDGDLLRPRVEDLATQLFALLDLTSSDEEIVALIDARSGKANNGTNIYGLLMSSPMLIPPSAPALVPSATAEDVLESLIFIAKSYTSISIAKVLFNTLSRLFHQVNDDFLVSEQYRHLRGIALAISLYGDNLTHPTILGFFLRETLPLLKLSDIAPIALAMLRFGFDQIKRAPQPPDNLDQMIIALGSAREGLATSRTEDLCAEIDAWITEQAPSWQAVEAMKEPLSIAKSIWPEHLADILDKIGSPLFSELCRHTEKIDSTDLLPMAQAMVRHLDTTWERKKAEMEMFQQSAFWQIKKSLLPSPRNKEAVSAFIELLYAGQGHINPPALMAAEPTLEMQYLSIINTFGDNDPVPYVRRAITDRIASMTYLPDHKARSTALRVLQGLIPTHMDDQAKAKAAKTLRTADKDGQYLGVLKSTSDLLALLNPINYPPMSTQCSAFSTLSSDDIWIKKAGDAKIWASSLATFLCYDMAKHSSYYEVLPALFEVIPSAAQELLPLLIQACLSFDSKTRWKERCKHIAAHFTLVLRTTSAAIDTTRAIVNVILHLRNFRNRWAVNENTTYESWLPIHPMLLSEGALKCGAFATALMFLEEVRNDRKDENRVLDLYDVRVQKIMYETYSNVEDPDGFYGVKTNDIADALQRRLQHEGEHWRSFGLHGAALESGLPSNQVAPISLLAMQDLHNLGFNHVSNAIFASLRFSADKATSRPSEPLLFELAWRTSDWDLPVHEETAPSAESLLYSSLRAVHRERDLATARSVVETAINKEILILRDCEMERTTQIKKAVADLLCLHEVQRWLESELQAALDGKDPQNHLERFTTLDSNFSFGDAERLTATRRSLFAASKSREAQDLFGDLATPRLEFLIQNETRSLLRLGEMARAQGNTRASINALAAVQQLEKTLGHASEAVDDEVGQTMWMQGEHVLAIQHVEERILALRKKEGSSRSRLAILLSRMANWTSKAKLRAPQDINAMFEDATRLAQAHKVSHLEQSQLNHDYAAFADQHQMALSKSPELERLQHLRERRDIDPMSSTPSASAKRSAKSSARPEMTDQLQKELREDEEAIDALMLERSTFAKIALKMYARALALSDVHDDSTTRMCSLWLELDRDDAVNTSFATSLARVPSSKFIFLGPQLAARLDKPRQPTPFNTALNSLVFRISVEHPYHILYQVITLAEGLPSSSKSKKSVDIGAEGRGGAAASILATISSDTTYGLALKACKNMRILATAATSWCLSRSREEENIALGRNMNVPTDCPLHRANDLGIPVATSPPAVDPLCRYENIPTLLRYRSAYCVLGGIHRPKKMQVLDSTGKTFRELFKGEDELRQDAVMEQVFEMSNKLLQRDQQSKARNLKFRTYVVIPLAKKTGIMEFVGDSKAIGDYLKPAHASYGKLNGDISADEFRRSLKPFQDKEKNWNQLPAKYSQLMENFHPVMRHFFTEKHKDPMAWFTMRLNYTRSVAVTSMVGWVLGIGDRHCSNILIDTKSGELVHIDFGIVFEDGRRLRIPERVPFRLTNDLVDGFGVTGVDGTFRRCSEHTVRVLREHAELIMTVLEVFKHDPLYAWDADPEKLQRAQGGGRVAAGTSATALEKADRILSKIRGKLRPDLSIEYTVNQLIQEARDVENLAKIFVGWQPWF